MEQIYFTRGELATLAGIGRSGLSLIEKHGKSDRSVFNGDGLISAEDAGNWLRAYALRKYSRGRPTTLKDEVDASTARKNAAIAEKAELANDARRAELVETAGVARAWQEIERRVRQRLLAIAPEVAPTLVGEADQHAAMERMDVAVRTALAELAAC
jgi:phage terminase Nu1 subunit (DNA packaging protein)